MWNLSVLILVLLSITLPSYSKHTSIPIWPEGVPNSLYHDKTSETGTVDKEGRVSKVHVPTISYFQPTTQNPSRVAIVICPGGAYARLSYEKEGVTTANWLAEIGVSAFVLKYRHHPYVHPSPLRDALQAIRFIRAHATAYNIDPNKIGILGFSAGGHLAACAATLYKDPDAYTGSSLDNISGKPDFMSLIYPVITMDDSVTHAPSRGNLIGDRPREEMIDRLSPHKNIKKTTPPAFIIHTGEDSVVSVQNSVLMYQALQANGVPVELHIYAQGPHGLGMIRNNSYPVTYEWPKLFQKWLRNLDFLE